MSDTGTQLSEEVTKIFAELPTRLNIVGILREAHARFVAVAGDVPPDVIAAQVVEVLREIASQAVGEFENRTGQQFFWVDKPDPAENPNNVLMHFGLDAKGNVTF